MKIYTYPRSRSLRVLWTLEELGANYSTVKAGLRSCDPEARSPHPFGKVPFMEDGNVSVSETLAICIYICEQHPGTELYPVGAEEKATVNSWLSFALTDLESPVWGLLKQRVFTPESQRSSDLINLLRREAQEAVSRVVLRAGSPWIAGEHFTLADIFISHTLQWAKLCDVPLSTDLDRYIGQAMARAAFSRAETRNNQ
ncbi:glutathione S-transferase family protein [Klebsiella michiganensis]|uniref:Glutathione S-transferase family protein n=1 Tax=Klebsiella michiganensis TaxID=1134687 RepID=A0A6P1V7H6_9ENTR|nr:glutathione S-transferase family protein [Klebsiella michiganensis]QHS50110.1 glutathione S-transferase family protein [Klebsiella michiganensis]HDX8940970.1 glutathione S-transferase family protein [Klebsiella michiganensis]